MSYTNRARLLVLPMLLLIPFECFASALLALLPAAKTWWWHAGFGESWRWWYRNVYRVARYGSVHD